MSAPTLTPKEFTTARALAAMQGLKLLRTDPADGPVVYLVEKYGQVRVIGDLCPAPN